MKVLVYGGAFNPPTRAHIDLSGSVRKKAGFDKVLFVPSKTTYIRIDQEKDGVFPDERRLAMLEAVAAVHPWMLVSDYEITQASQPRTYQTLCHFRKQGMDCGLLIGADKLIELETGWRHVREIAHEFGIYCMQRDGLDLERLISESAFLSDIREYIHLYPSPLSYQTASSSAIRARLREYEAIRKELMGMLPEELHDSMDEMAKEIA